MDMTPPSLTPYIELCFKHILRRKSERLSYYSIVLITLKTWRISWKGILQQYAGRLHRAHADKADVRVIDFVDAGNVALMRMWDKRQARYKAMGYRMADSLATMDLL
ncbi:hypothetical protein, partial [Pseudomonas gessardii]|uniref:hypothetical protein n=1 Tax=Pseudomonas gessardii TaxID=78544 RepID=UPI002E33F060